jgi:hypothetical protein
MKAKADSRLVLCARKWLMRWVISTHALLLSNIPYALSEATSSQKLGYALVTGSAVPLCIAAGVALWLVAVKLKP